MAGPSNRFLLVTFTFLLRLTTAVRREAGGLEACDHLTSNTSTLETADSVTLVMMRAVTPSLRFTVRQMIFNKAEEIDELWCVAKDPGIKPEVVMVVCYFEIAFVNHF